jgi:aryl carrier-like protein
MSDVSQRIAALSPEQRDHLLRRLREQTQGTAAAVPEVPRIPEGPFDRHRPFPLTEIQEVFWAGRSGLFDLGGSGANVYLEYEFPSPETVWPFAARLSQALRRVIERHEVLRTVVLPDGRQQVLAEVPPFDVGAEDLSDWTDERIEKHLESVREELRYARPPADRWPLFEVVLFQLKEGRIRLQARFDALLIDGTARNVLLNELVAFVNDWGDRLPPVGVSYLDYARALEAFHDTATWRRCRDYWLQRAPSLPPPPRLPLARDIGPETVPRLVKRTEPMLEPEDWRALKRRAGQEGITPSSLLAAAFAEVLGRWCAAPRFSLGMVATYRPEVHPDLPRALGTFNTLYLLEVEGGGGSFRARARQLQQRLTADLEHQSFSGFRVLREWNRLHRCGARSVMPILFDSILEYSRAGAAVEPGQDAPAATEVTEAPPRPQARVDLTEMDLRISLPQVLLLCVVMEGEDGRLDTLTQSVDELFPSGLIPALLAGLRRLLERLASEETSWSEAAPAPPASLPLDFPPEPVPLALGYGTDLRRVEATLRSHAGVREAAVAWRERAGGRGGRLIAWIACDKRPPDDEELRRYLRERLPAHLVPAGFVRLESLGRPASELPVPPEPASRTAELWDEVERELAGLWGELLERAPEHSDDDFFALGGDSLAAVRLLGRLREHWGERVPVANLFAVPTLEEMAAAMRRAAPRSAIARLGGWLRRALPGT